MGAVPYIMAIIVGVKRGQRPKMDSALYIKIIIVIVDL
jgi:hypothetical protein